MATNIKDFLNARSSVTMGASAAMVIAFTTTLCSAFPLPAAIVALCLSGLFAGVQVAYSKDKPIIKALFWVVCMLVIFNASVGGNTALSGMAKTEVAPVVAPFAPMSTPVGGLPHPKASSRLIVTQDVDYKVSEMVTNVVFLYDIPIISQTKNKLFEQWKWTNRE